MVKVKRAWIGAGGNIGDVQLTLVSALKDINLSKHSRINDVSSLYLTKAWGNEDQDDFINIVFEIGTTLEPEDLLRFCQEIEAKYKRQRLVKWGPRTLDLDILIYEGVDNYHSKNLTLPHEYITQRIFVLKPLSEIAPDLKINNKSIDEWCNDFNNNGIEKLNTTSNWWEN